MARRRKKETELGSGGVRNDGDGDADVDEHEMALVEYSTFESINSFRWLNSQSLTTIILILYT